VSQRERLLSRKRPSDVYTLQVDDDTEPRKKLGEARAMLRLLQAQGEEAEETAVRAARETLAEAEAEVAACYEDIVLRALKPRDFEKLIGKHKPRPDTDDVTWDQETFPGACFLACAESDMGEADWERFLVDNVSDAEQADLYAASVRVNVRLPEPSLPKGWTQTRS
jgi:hypothetical protein